MAGSNDIRLDTPAQLLLAAWKDLPTTIPNWRYFLLLSPGALGRVRGHRFDMVREGLVFPEDTDRQQAPALTTGADFNRSVTGTSDLYSRVQPRVVAVPVA